MVFVICSLFNCMQWVFFFFRLIVQLFVYLFSLLKNCSCSIVEDFCVTCVCVCYDTCHVFFFFQFIFVWWGLEGFCLGFCMFGWVIFDAWYFFFLFHLIFEFCWFGWSRKETNLWFGNWGIILEEFYRFFIFHFSFFGW